MVRISCTGRSTDFLEKLKVEKVPCQLILPSLFVNHPGGICLRNLDFPYPR
jgi:hypothetical protein